MPKLTRPSREEVSKAIHDYLEKHPEIGGIRELSERTSLSYDSLQKYAKGSNAPPPGKWERLCAAIGYSPSENDSTKHGLFYSGLENSIMTEENSDSTNPQNDDTKQKDSPSEKADSTPEDQASAQADETQVLSDLMVDNSDWSRAEDRQETFLPASGFTWFYPEEMKIIDHPAFQRLAGMHQLGMTHLVYRGATHRRIEHALGAVGLAQRMLEAATHNCLKRSSSAIDPKDQWLLGHPPTKFERRFIRLGTLLHDIGHVPYGHTIEDELRLLNKHDGEERVEQIFNSNIWHDVKTETLGEIIDRQYEKLMPKELTKNYRPSDLLKRIILKLPKDATEEQKKEDQETQEICANAGLRITICRDMVGNTICADLLDYLHRDWYHLGKPRYFDERILHYMEIRTPESNKPILKDSYPDPTARDVFVISIGNRPKLRTDGISAILSLLESRYELAEAVLFHRTKMNATAMLERALSFCIPQSAIEKSGSQSQSPTHPDKGKVKADDPETQPENVKQALERWLIENPEEVLLPALLKGEGPVKEGHLTAATKADWEHGRSLVSKLLRRDLYEQLMIVTYDEFEGRDVHSIQKMYGDDKNAAANRAKALHLLEKDFDLTPGSIVMYCPESRMNKKIAEVQLFVENIVERFDKFEEENDDALSAGHLKAQLVRFKKLWKIGFFTAPEVRQKKGDSFLSELRYAIRAFVLNLYPRQETLETESARIARSVVRINTFHLYGREALSSPFPLQSARTDSAVVTDVYPTGARTLLDYISKDERNSSSRDAKKGTPAA